MSTDARTIYIRNISVMLSLGKSLETVPVEDQAEARALLEKSGVRVPDSAAAPALAEPDKTARIRQYGKKSRKSESY